MASFRDLFNLTLKWWSVSSSVTPIGTTTGNMRVFPRLSGHLRVEILESGGAIRSLSRMSGHLRIDPRMSGNILVEPRMAEGIRSRTL